MGGEGGGRGTALKAGIIIWEELLSMNSFEGGVKRRTNSFRKRVSKKVKNHGDKVLVDLKLKFEEFVKLPRSNFVG